VLPVRGLDVLVAVALGLLIGNVVALPDAVRPGVRFAVKRVLQLGIVLLGARLSLHAVAAVGLETAGLVVALMLVALCFVIGLGRVLGLPKRLVLLIAVGTAVCGNSAIAATAPIVDAEEREVSFAVATITLFGTLAVFAYPLIAAALSLTSATYGVWAGTAINDTSQVVAAGTAYGGAALTIATIVKLTRNALMAPLLFAISYWWARKPESAARGARAAVPFFVLGFLALTALRTAGVIDDASSTALGSLSHVLVVVALAAVGLNTSVRQMRTSGLRPFYLGLGASIALGLLSLFAILGLGIAPAVG
jgi:uncharacterized integral membrane protein (TIGR00698 family)